MWSKSPGTKVKTSERCHDYHVRNYAEWCPVFCSKMSLLSSSVYHWGLPLSCWWDTGKEVHAVLLNNLPVPMACPLGVLTEVSPSSWPQPWGQKCSQDPSLPWRGRLGPPYSPAVSRVPDVATSNVKIKVKAEKRLILVIVLPSCIPKSQRLRTSGDRGWLSSANASEGSPRGGKETYKSLTWTLGLTQ
jgi:hypothetical protein